MTGWFSKESQYLNNNDDNAPIITPTSRDIISKYMKSTHKCIEIFIDKFENPPSSERYFLTDRKIRIDTASLKIPSPNKTELSIGYSVSLINVSAATVS